MLQIESSVSASRGAMRLPQPLLQFDQLDHNLNNCARIKLVARVWFEALLGHNNCSGKPTPTELYQRRAIDRDPQ